MNTETDHIAIIIPVLNLFDRYTKPCIKSFLASNTAMHDQFSFINYSFIIIDNASTDDTSQKVRDLFDEIGFPNYAIVRNDVNKGCSASWNQGVEKAIELGCTHFVVANNDILVGPNTLLNLYKRLTRGDKVLVAALDISGEVPVPEVVLDANADVNKKDDSESPHPNFSCFMISKETIDRVGWFDERYYPAYFEDNDYHYRVRLVCGDDSAITTTTAPFYHFGSRTQNEALGGIPVVPGPAFKDNERKYGHVWGGLPRQEAWRVPFNDGSLTPKLNRDMNYQIVE